MELAAIGDDAKNHVAIFVLHWNYYQGHIEDQIHYDLVANGFEFAHQHTKELYHLAMNSNHWVQLDPFVLY